MGNRAWTSGVYHLEFTAPASLGGNIFIGVMKFPDALADDLYTVRLSRASTAYLLCLGDGDIWNGHHRPYANAFVPHEPVVMSADFNARTLSFGFGKRDFGKAFDLPVLGPDEHWRVVAAIYNTHDKLTVRSLMKRPEYLQRTLNAQEREAREQARLEAEALSATAAELMENVKVFETGQSPQKREVRCSLL
eukprot:TRINITY_DN2172_c0_g1_i3.p1 TRINITY_DN2172_c0_g1~~TRINITY_DN2172_c0_g1_i3.p1  ORF type:complete len:192 (+),score=48.47 TRINITY_DN2172_c0_g1_i3:422-997(+)